MIFLMCLYQRVTTGPKKKYKKYPGEVHLHTHFNFNLTFIQKSVLPVVPAASTGCCKRGTERARSSQDMHPSKNYAQHDSMRKQ